MTNETTPTPPLPHAAADTAAEAGERELAEAESPLPITTYPRAAMAITQLWRMAGETTEAIILARGVTDWLKQTAASNAELSATLSRLDADWERTCAAVRQEYEAEVARLSAELAAVRGAAAEWSAARREYDALGDQEGNFDLDDEWRLRDVERKAAARLDAALATATPAPPAAEAGTGGELRTGEEWRALLYPDMTIYDADGWRNRGWHTQITQLTREEFEAAFMESTIVPLPSPPTPQEADHAAR